MDEAIYLVPGLPPISPERDDPAEPDHKGENSRLSYQLSVMSYERSAPHQLIELMEGKRGGLGRNTQIEVCRVFFSF